MGKGARNRELRKGGRRFLRCADCGHRYGIAGGMGVMGPFGVMHAKACPKCRRVNGLQIFREGDVRLEQQQMDVLGAFLLAAADRVTAERLADQIEQSYPRYKVLAAWLRENPWFMGLAAPLLASVLTVLLTFLINHPAPTHVEITRIVVNNGGGPPAAGQP